MMHVDWWSWQCATCGWKVKSQLTVNHQEAVADTLIKRHLQEHAAAGDTGTGPQHGK